MTTTPTAAAVDEIVNGTPPLDDVETTPLGFAEPVTIPTAEEKSAAVHKQVAQTAVVGLLRNVGLRLIAAKDAVETGRYADLLNEVVAAGEALDQVGESAALLAGTDAESSVGRIIDSIQRLTESDDFDVEAIIAGDKVAIADPTTGAVEVLTIDELAVKFHIPVEQAREMARERAAAVPPEVRQRLQQQKSLKAPAASATVDSAYL